MRKELISQRWTPSVIDATEELLFDSTSVLLPKTLV